MTDKIEVLDAVMGSGKSTAILKWCEANSETSYLYVTPLLSESEVRVVNACEDAKFTAPSNETFRTKGEHLLDLLGSGVNVSITHALYSSLRDAHLKLIEANNYVVILDEEVSFIEPLGDGYTKADFEYLRHLKQIDVDETGKLLWLDSEVGDDTKYSKLANMCRLGMVYQAKRDNSMFVTQLPMSLISKAKRVILLTYLFDGSILDSFLKMKGVSVVPFTDVKLEYHSGVKLSSLVEFVGDRQVREWATTSLSSSWYKNTATQKDMTKIANAIRAIGTTNKAHFKDLLWCVPASVARPRLKSGKKVTVKSYGAGTGIINEEGIAEGCFLTCNSRATNAYRDRSVMVHCYNRFPHTTVTAFLQDHGVFVDTNQFALSELLQWLWRSRIRNGEPIKVCILSKRMRLLFQEWLKDK